MPNKLKIPEQLFREATFERESVDEEKRTVRLSASSDLPYKRFWGTEILSHAADAIRMQRIKTSGALLFNHNRDAHIGRIISAETDGKKLNVVAKFGNSPLAKEKFQDVMDGILREASIGYEIHKMVERDNDNDDDEDIFEAIDWEPYEVSMVTVPADASVGVGRTREIEIAVDSTKETKAKNMAEPVSTQEPAPKIDVVAERTNAIADFKAKQKKIFDFVAAIKQPNLREIAHKVADKHAAGEANFDEFRNEYLNQSFDVQPVDTPDTKIGMSKKERGRFSLVKLIRDVATTGSPQGLEKDACETMRTHLDKIGDNRSDHSGYSLPDDILESRFDEDHDLDSRALGNLRGELRQLNRNLAASTGSTGGYLIGVDLLTGSFIELLRNRALVYQLGPTFLGGLVNNVSIPKQITGSTVYWLAEGAAVTESDQAFGTLALTPHRLGVDTAYTKQLVNQASLSVEAFVRDDMARQAAVERDRVALHGGTNAGEPLGIFNTPGVQTITFSAAATWAKMVQFETDIESANALLGPMTFLTTPGTKLKLKTAAKTPSSNFPIFIWESGDYGAINGVPSGEINGYPAYSTNNISGNKVVFGVWSELIIADWAGVDVVVDPYSLKKQEQVEVTMHQWMDQGIRHPVAFEVSTDSGAQ